MHSYYEYNQYVFQYNMKNIPINQHILCDLTDEYCKIDPNA